MVISTNIGKAVTGLAVNVWWPFVVSYHWN